MLSSSTTAQRTSWTATGRTASDFTGQDLVYEPFSHTILVFPPAESRRM